MQVDLVVENRLQYEKKVFVTPSMMHGIENDLALVHRIAAGEDAALHELYLAYGQRLYAYALRLTGDPSQAEDVTQDALVVMWKSARNFRGEGRVIAWMLGIVHHLALKTLRHRPQPITDEMEETLDAGALSLDDQVVCIERVARVRAALISLSPEHRAVLELVFYQGLNLREVAQVCRIPLGTVKSRLSYARRNLRTALVRQDLEIR